MDCINSTKQDSYEKMKARGMEYIRSHLKQSRYEHSMRVMDEAVRLANRFGADSAKAEIAAVYHDMAKNLPLDEMNALIEEFDLDDRYIDNPNLAHSKLAACLMQRDFDITQPDLLNAVSYHTTGRAGMELLEKIIFLADAIEPKRDYPSVDKIRRIAETDLDLACITALERTIDYLKMKNARIDPDTEDALKDLLRRRSMK